MDERKVIVEFSYKTIIWVMALILSLWLIVQLKEILVALVLAFILATAASPLIDRLQKKIPRTFSITIVYLSIIAVLVLVLRLIIPPFARELSGIFQNRELYIDKIQHFLATFSPSTADSVTKNIEKFLLSAQNISISSIFSGAKGFFGGVVQFVLVFVLSFYMLLSKNGARGMISSYIPKQYQKRSLAIYKKVSDKMTLWLQGQLFLCLIIFAINLVGLMVLRVPYALTLALLAGLFEILPIIGPWISGAVGISVAFTQSPLLALTVAVWYILVQQTEGHVLVPVVMKKSLGISPVAVILAVLIGAKFMGIIGILISVPIAASIAVFIEEFIKLKEEEGN